MNQEPLYSNTAYIVADSPQNAILYGLSLKEAMVSVQPRLAHQCNCSNCHRNAISHVYKVLTTVLEEVPYQDPKNIKEGEENE